MSMNSESGGSESERIAREVNSRATAIKELREVAEAQNFNIAMLTGSVRDLAAAVQARPTHREALSLVSVSSLVTLLIVGGIFFLQFQQNSRTNQVLDVLLECTTTTPPGAEDVHDCYVEGRERSNDVIRNINLTTVFAAECSIENATGRTQKTVAQCVSDKVAAFQLQEEQTEP